MKRQAQSDPFSRDALGLLFHTLDTLEAAARETGWDFEDLQAEIDQRASYEFARYLELPATQAKLRRRAWSEYVTRIWELHRKQVTKRQICQTLHVDESDFRKYLKGQKFSLDSAVVLRINEFLLGDKPPLGS
jgi:hypothetical protein